MQNPLTARDKQENLIKVIIVVPKNARLFHYWVNGALERRAMMKNSIMEFCFDLVPEKAAEIRSALDEVRSFVLYVEEKTFAEIEEEPQKPKSKASTLFPMRERIKKDTYTSNQNADEISEQSDRFNILKKFNIKMDSLKNNSSNRSKSLLDCVLTRR